MSWQITAKISRRSRLCCLPALQTRVSVVILPVAGDREAPSAVAQPGVGSGVHGQRPGELERGDASQALPEQRTVRSRCRDHRPAGGGRPRRCGSRKPGRRRERRSAQAGGHHAGSLYSAEPHRRAEDDAARRVSRRESGGHMALSELLAVPVWCCPVLDNAICAHNPRGRGFKSRPRYQEIAGQEPDRRTWRSGFDLCGSAMAAGSADCALVMSGEGRARLPFGGLLCITAPVRSRRGPWATPTAGPGSFPEFRVGRSGTGVWRDRTAGVSNRCASWPPVIALPGRRGRSSRLAPGPDPWR